MKNLLIGLLIIVAFIGGYFFSQRYNFKIEPKESINQIPTITTLPTTKPSEIVGNDLDPYGCKSSAGYSWCEAKQKCLRVFEEKCEIEKAENLQTIIKELLVQKHGPTANELNVTVAKQIGDYARGGASASGGGGMWLSKKINGSWKLVFDGNGAADCTELKTTYLFSSEMLTGICD